MHKDFNQDYKKYYLKNETKKKTIGTPFLLKSKTNNNIGILLIHGYMAAPFEVMELSEFLKDKGYVVFATRLKGHGTSPEDLSQRQYEDWIESAKEAYVFLENSCKKVIIGGFSAGAAIALYMQTIIKNCPAVFAISPPMRLKDRSVNFVPTVNMWNKIMKKVDFKKFAKDFIKNNPEHPHINYTRNPLVSINELEKLIDDLNKKIEKIKTPSLIIQSRQDPVVDYKGTLQMFEKLKCKKKEILLFDYKKHGILIGKNNKRIFKSITDFLEEILQ